ncbi:MAG: efflux RND transporter periplasmic adaptor subunit [Patescibacteria group bacterium]
MNQKKVEKAKRFFLRKRVLIPAALILLIVILLLVKGSSDDTISVVSPTIGDLSQTVRATGQVTSKTDINLSFNSSGMVRSLKVETGDKVKSGQILASLDQGSVLASLTQARGALAAAEARLKRTLEGSSNEEIALAQITYDQTKKTQETLVKNAYYNLLNSTPEAVPITTTNDYAAPVISGTYNLNKEGIIRIKTYINSGGSSSFTVSGLTVGTGIATTMIPQPIGDSGLYITFPSSTDTNLTEWVVAIPNKKAANYLSNLNAYEAAVTQGELLVDQKEAELALKKAEARGSDVDLARADITSAQGQVQAAQARYEDTIIRAPSDGTITDVAVKYGEQTDSQKTAIVLQDVDHLYIEADINESNIATVKLGQSVDIIFDAFGNEKKFTGSVAQINPSSVAADGVVNYKIKVSVNESDDAIRPGMNAEITITALTKENVLSVPRASVTVRDNVSYVNVITNEKRKTYEEREITTGLVGDGNLVEIQSGLSADDRIALFVK